MKRLWLALALAVAASAEEARTPDDFTVPYPQGVVARVNKTPILTGTIVEQIRDLVPGLRNAYPDPKDFDAELARLFDVFLLREIRNELIRQAAALDSFVITEAELDVQERVFCDKHAGGDRERMKQLLAQQGVTMARWREMTKYEMLEQRVTWRRISHADLYVTPREIQAFYRQHPELFRKPERARALVVPFVAETQRAADRALHLAEGVRAQVEAGASLADVARWLSPAADPKSLEPSWSARGELDPALERTLFAAAPGALVGPVQGSRAIYLARLESLEAAVVVSFEEAQPEISKHIEVSKIREAQNRVFGDLVRKAEISLTPAVEHLRRYLEPDRRE